MVNHTVVAIAGDGFLCLTRAAQATVLYSAKLEARTCCTPQHIGHSSWNMLYTKVKTRSWAFWLHVKRSSAPHATQKKKCCRIKHVQTLLLIQSPTKIRVCTEEITDLHRKKHTCGKHKCARKKRGLCNVVYVNPEEYCIPCQQVKKKYKTLRLQTVWRWFAIFLTIPKRSWNIHQELMIRFQKKSRTSKNTNVQIIISLSVTPPSMFRQVSTTESTKCRKALRKRTRRIERTTWSNLHASQEFHKILDMSHHAISHFVRFGVQIHPSHLVTLKIRIMRNCDAEPPPSARGREAVTDAMVSFLQTIAPEPLHNCNILELVFHIPKPLSGQSVQCSSPVANAFLFSPAYFKSSQTYGELDPSWNHYLGIRFNPHCILIF